MKEIIGILYRRGDLICATESYHPSINRYYNIVDIVDEYGISHNEYYIITGYGDKNSNVVITAKPIADLHENVHYDISQKIVYIEEDIINIKTRDIIKIDIDYLEEVHNKYLIRLNNKMDFVKKHRNRIDKLDFLLE